MLRLNIEDKTDLQRGDKPDKSFYFSIYYGWKDRSKSHIKNKVKILRVKQEMKNLKYLVDLILYQIFKIISKTPFRSMEH